MALELANWSIPDEFQPKPDDFTFDAAWAVFATVGLHAAIPANAFTAGILGTERVGHGVAIDAEGTVLTIGYLVTEAEEVWLVTGDGDTVPAHVLGIDSATGFGLVRALRPLPVPALTVGNSREAQPGEKVLVAAGGRLDRSITARVVARQEFAGYWEYLLDDALFTSPGHPLWSGAAVIGESGRLVGLCSLQMQEEAPGGRLVPLNMVVPIDLLAPILSDLMAGRPSGPPRPWLGILAAEDEGQVTIIGTSPGGPAQRAELRGGDIVMAVGGRPIATLADFYRSLWSLGEAGVKAPLTLQREGDVFDVAVTTRDRNQLLKKPILH
jgi:S1-C subfamily serine protease